MRLYNTCFRALCNFFGQYGHRPPKSEGARTPMIGGAGFENFENVVTAATGLSCNSHRISRQCTRACESGLVSVQSALNTKPSLDMLVQTTPVSPRKCTPSPK